MVHCYLLHCCLLLRRYGAVPVVRKTGGLADTVRDVDSHAPGEGNGYTFDGTDEGSLHAALDRWGQLLVAWHVSC
jgi:starch synthase